MPVRARRRSRVRWGTIPAGQSRQITPAFFVPSGYSSPNPISNTPTVTTTAADQDPSDNQATVTTSVSVPSADLFITKAGPASVTPPMNVTYVVQVTNNGPGDATGVTVSDATPGGLAFVGNSGDCQTSFPCNLGTIPAGESRTIQTTFAVPSVSAGPGVITNTATVGAATSDPDPATTRRPRRRS